MGIINRMIKTSLMAATTSLIANVLNLDDTKVGKILGFAIPMITFVTADDPSISSLLFGNSKKKNKKRKDKKKNKDKGGLFSKKESEKEFFDVFGKKGHAMSKFIAKETDSTEEEVNGVLGMTMGLMEATLGRAIEEDDVDEKGFNKWFKDEAEEQKKKRPSLFKMTMKTIF
ncbi:MAG: hypothetical protein ACK2UV_01550 [Candidatus Promineifilaceae bacterium]